MDNSENYPGWKDVTELLQDYPGQNDQINNIISNWLSNITYKNATGGKMGINTRGGVGILFLFKNTFNLTETQWKQQYPNLVLDLYYNLPIPTYEIITNENLIEQLNNILDIELIEDLCYVDWVGTEKPTMKLTYYVDTDKILEKLREE